MKLENILKIVILVIGVICAFFLIRILNAGDDAIEADAGLQGSLISPFLVIGYIVLGATIVIALLFTIINLLKTPSLLKTVLIAIGAFVAVVLASYFVSSGEETTIGDITLSGAKTKWVSAGLITFYVLIVIAGGLIAYTGIRKAIK